MKIGCDFVGGWVRESGDRESGIEKSVAARCFSSLARARLEAWIANVKIAGNPSQNRKSRPTPFFTTHDLLLTTYGSEATKSEAT